MLNVRRAYAISRWDQPSLLPCGSRRRLRCCNVKVTGQFHDLYDQAGLMVRIDAENWMKCGVEFVDGKQNMSIVYTRDFSN
jgi:regulation of enolase protein 1 (concanavalin A-like superfamily)